MSTGDHSSDDPKKNPSVRRKVPRNSGSPEETSRKDDDLSEPRFVGTGPSTDRVPVIRAHFDGGSSYFDQSRFQGGWEYSGPPDHHFDLDGDCSGPPDHHFDLDGDCSGPPDPHFDLGGDCSGPIRHHYGFDDDLVGKSSAASHRTHQLQSKLAYWKHDLLTIMLQRTEEELLEWEGNATQALLFSLARIKDTISNDLTPSDVRNMAFKMKELERFIHSLILCNVANDMFKLKSYETSPDGRVKWISGCILVFAQAIEGILNLGRLLNWRSHAVAVNYGLSYMVTMLHDLQEISNATGDMKAINEGHCTQNVAFVTYLAGSYDKSILLCEKGLSLMQSQFGDRLMDHKCYVKLLHILALNHEMLEQYQDAEFYCFRALEMCRRTNYTNVTEKEHDIIKITTDFRRFQETASFHLQISPAKKSKSAPSQQIVDKELKEVIKILERLEFKKPNGTQALKIDPDPAVPYEEKTEEVGCHGKLFEVGGCSVYFPPRCFADSQKVTVSADIDPSKWPEGKSAITPCLNVKASNLKKKATVNFTTWCVVDDDADSTVDILHYDGETKKWEVVHSCQLKDSRSVTFKCKHFSPLIAVLRRIVFGIYAMAPAVYSLKQRFAVTIMLDQKLARRRCHDMMERNLGSKVQKFEMSVFTCKAAYNVQSQLSCIDPEEGFTFSRTHPFTHDVRDIIATTQPSVTNTTLRSKQGACPITLNCEIIRNGISIRQDDIHRYWSPVESHENRSSSEVNRPNKFGRDRQSTMSGSSGNLSSSSSALTATDSLHKANESEDSEQLQGGRTFATNECDSPSQNQASGESPTSFHGSSPHNAVSSSCSTVAPAGNSKESQTTIHMIVQPGAIANFNTGSVANEVIHDATIHTINKGTYRSENKDCQDHIHSTINHGTEVDKK